MKDWEKVYESWDLPTATMVMGILVEHGVPAKTLDKKDSAFVFLGKVEVLVPKEFVQAAQALIEDLTL